MSFESQPHTLESYLPESDFWARKRVRGCRICFEDVAVLDANRSFLTVAYRGILPLEDLDFFSAVGLPADERAFLCSALASHRRLVLRSSRGAILLLADFLCETGLCLAIRLHPSSEGDLDAWDASLLRALECGGNTAFVRSSACSRLSLRARAEDVKMLRRLDEIFFYLEGLSREKFATVSLPSLILRLANFAGCDPQKISLPARLPELSLLQAVRMIFFLFCSCLVLRQSRGGAIFEAKGEGSAPSFALRIALSSVSTARATSGEMREAALAYPFLQCACFEDAEQLLLPDGDTLQTKLHLTHEPATVGSASAFERYLLSVCLLTA